MAIAGIGTGYSAPHSPFTMTEMLYGRRTNEGSAQVGAEAEPSRDLWEIERDAERERLRRGIEAAGFKP